MRIYKSGAKIIFLAGVTYRAEPDGAIDVPDNLVHAAYSKGFVNADKRVVQKPAVQIIDPVQVAQEPAKETKPAEPKKITNNTKEANV